MIPEDFDPTNYQPQYWDDAGRKRLVRDEREWLARPDIWATRVLPESRSRTSDQIAMFSFLKYIIQHFVLCSPCAIFYGSLISEDGCDWENCVQETRHFFKDSGGVDGRMQLREKLSCNCSVKIWQNFVRHDRGLCTRKEVEIQAYDYLLQSCSNFTTFLAGNPETVELRTQFECEQQKLREYKRWLALELCGPNPFRPVAFDPAWRTSTTVGIAAQMYDTRDFGAMPILADALQDAGCENDAILRHCREEGTHVRGCWVVDLVLEK